MADERLKKIQFQAALYMLYAGGIASGSNLADEALGISRVTFTICMLVVACAIDYWISKSSSAPAVWVKSAAAAIGLTVLAVFWSVWPLLFLLPVIIFRSVWAWMELPPAPASNR